MLFAGSFRISVYSRVKIKSLKHAHIIFFGLLNLLLFKHAGSFIRYVLYSYLFSYFKKPKRSRRPDKNKYVIYRAGGAGGPYGKKLCPRS